MVKGKFSVVIPTLQRSPDLWPLVDQLAAHPLVHEVLVVNNAPEPLAWESPKVRVLQQAQNIYVNPAWNLGAREAAGEFLALVNDDVLFDTYLFDIAYGLLRRPWLAGMVGLHGSCFTGAPKNIWVRPSVTREWGFGTAMFLRTDRYVPIPDEMKVWCGDDWLFEHQGQLAWVVGGLPVQTEVATTSGSPEFREILAADSRAWDRYRREMRPGRPAAVGRRLVGVFERAARRMHLLNP